MLWSHVGVHLPGQSTDLGYRLSPKAWTVLGVSGMKRAGPGLAGGELGPAWGSAGRPGLNMGCAAECSVAPATEQGPHVTPAPHTA